MGSISPLFWVCEVVKNRCFCGTSALSWWRASKSGLGVGVVAGQFVFVRGGGGVRKKVVGTSPLFYEFAIFDTQEKQEIGGSLLRS